ncbi:MAG: Strongly similar to phosphonopyruvate decarboxylase [uncultured bacterium]|nr:MAG: Strongly similar to phosphonopyruvate decarboxylase [uncultured bacterium]
MKRLFIVAESISDLPNKKFDDRTPLELSRTPNLDRMAKNGCIGLCNVLPSSCIPGSDVGFISLLGSNPSKSRGARGYFEIKGLGLDLKDDAVPFRVNLIPIQEGVATSYASTSISDDECSVIVSVLNECFKDIPLSFYPISGYRMALAINKEWLFEGKRNNLKMHNLQNNAKFILQDNFPKGNGSAKLIQIMNSALEILSAHEINQVKIDLGENPANGIWLWSNETPKGINNFKKLFSADGICVPGSHLVRGICIEAGLETVNVIGAHKGGQETLNARVDAAMNAFKFSDMVILHIETIDDVSKEGDLHKKCQSIESFDEKVVGRMIDFLETKGEFRILVTSSHSTLIQSKLPTRMPVPWVLYGSGVKPDKSNAFNEKEAQTSRFSTVAGEKLLKKTLFI